MAKINLEFANNVDIFEKVMDDVTTVLNSINQVKAKPRVKEKKLMDMIDATVPLDRTQAMIIWDCIRAWADEELYTKETPVTEKKKKDISYKDCISVLMADTTISSFYKNSILDSIPTASKSNDIYAAIVDVIRSDMSSFYKDDTIKKLVKRFR